MDFILGKFAAVSLFSAVCLLQVDWHYSVPLLAAADVIVVHHCQCEEVQVFICCVSYSLSNYNIYMVEGKTVATSFLYHR